MESSQAEALKARLLYQDVCRAARRLDCLLLKRNAHEELFKPHVLALRDMVQQVCIKLMFLHPVDYGRKAEELLWRKTYSDVALLLLKPNRTNTDSSKQWEGPLRTHLKGGLRFYEHLFLFLQEHYQLGLWRYIDWPHSAIRFIGCQRAGPASEEEVDWARMACHRCLLYLGDLFRFQNEFLALHTTGLAEKCYYRALSVAPHMGMPFNQLGSLTGSKYYDVEATYFYQRCLHSEVPFRGASWNLKRLYYHAGKRYSRLKRCQRKKLSPSQRRCWDNKRLLVSFLYLQSLLQPQRKFRASRLMALCQLVLEDFRLCLSYRPCPSDQSQASKERKPARGYQFLPDLLIFRMVVLCLMSVHSLRTAGSKQHRTAVTFTLTLFSHLIQHVTTRLQAELQRGKLTPEADVPRDEEDQQKVEAGERQQDPPAPCPGPCHSKSQKTHRSSHVSTVGDNPEASFHSCCDWDETDEDENTSLCSQVSSELSSETTYSDTTDDEESGSLNPQAMQEGGAKSKNRISPPGDKLKTCQSPSHLLGLLKTTSSASLSAPSSHKLPGKRGFHLAPVFSHSFPTPPSPASSKASVTEDGVSSCLETEPPAGCNSGQKASISQPCSNLQTIQKKLQVLSAEGLLPTVKVILGWLRANCSLLTARRWSLFCLWDHLSMLLNLLPSVRDLQEPGLGLSHHLRELLQSCKGPHLPQFLQLPEDIALGQHWLRQASQERAGLEQDPPPLSSRDEAAVRVCFLRSFGHFATTLPGQFLRYDSHSGVFVSTGFEGPDNPSQQLLEKTSRIRFFKDIVQLWLQREVVLLEKTLRHIQIQSALTPYLLPDPRALCEHLPVIRQLATSGQFLLIVPSIVVDILYVLRREDKRASAAITFLEGELKRGNQYLLCQSCVSVTLVRPRMTRPDSDAWDLYNMLDFCRGLLDSSWLETPDHSSMITILTGICLDNPRNLSYPLQLVLGVATEAGVDVKNVLRFYRKWKMVS
ncbi:nonsense-mediated mRNA decay factor SMG5-like [Dama dama]|uniref:nonsense-mediated mRNA decay factor SMG5-like n=1 Tax=Dama dama TaxID=30532 RepID=UPI002A36C356|nr:nonsense-mediated mRNA decay factor SMG5-like [Dama dama]